MILLRFMPVVLSAPTSYLFWNRGGEAFFWKLLLSALQAQGPIAVKFAQWASTRPDILPPRVCTHFAELQEGVSAHPYRQTEKALKEAFGPDWQQALQVEQTPIGSGCMAQVYRGKLRQAGSIREVAVKVRHPGAREKVDLDLDLMWRAVGVIEALFPSARYLAMSEALGHFEAFVRPQADLRIEASNLETFERNFPYRRKKTGLPVLFPEIIRPYVAEGALVESFETALPLQSVLDQRGSPEDVVPGVSVAEVQDRVGKLCMDAFMKMLFTDNFIHGDLHPGNIHFRWEQKLELVVLDAGLAVELTPESRRNFVEVFHAISTNDGRRAGQLMLERTPGDRTRIIDPDTFVEGVAVLVDNFRSGAFALGKVRLGEVFNKMIGLACDHRVMLETGFVTVATSIIVIEGVGRQLNPVVDLILAARPLLLDAMMNRL